MESGQEPKLDDVDPRAILNKIETVTNEVGNTFNELMGSLERLQVDIRQLDQLKDVVRAAEKMLSGQHEIHVQTEAQGEVGRLVSAINKTLENLQQLDQTVQQETGKVPELASHLDQITEETESATSKVLERLDAMIESSEAQNTALQTIREESQRRTEMDREALERIEAFMKKVSADEDQSAILEEAMDFIALMGQQARLQLDKSQEEDQALASASEQADNLMNHAFDIMNLLQFQDITRQKVGKVIALLKEMQTGLFRLLEIFNIRSARDNELELTEKHKATQDKILDRDAFGSDASSTDVDEIIRNFQSQ